MLPSAGTFQRSVEVLASPRVTKWTVSPAGRIAWTRCEKSLPLPSGSRKVTMSPTRAASGEIGSVTSTSPVSIAGVIEPERTVKERSPIASGAAAASSEPKVRPRQSQMTKSQRRRSARECSAIVIVRPPPRC